MLVDEFDVPISLRPLSVGYGVGSRDGGSVPNLLRLTVGDVEDRPGASAVWELSTNVDNVSGEVLAHALRLALDQGALDVWATPTVTKKSRPAHWIVALSDDAHLTQVEDVLLAELPTLGLRRQRVERRSDRWSKVPDAVDQRERYFAMSLKLMPRVALMQQGFVAARMATNVSTQPCTPCWVRFSARFMTGASPRPD